jgi:branched-chain amino acid transport system substrate-binding protein
MDPLMGLKTQGGSVRKPLVQVRIAIGVATLMASILVGGVTVTQAGASTRANTASAPGITKNSIKIGIISDLTGASASSFADTPGSMEARFKSINAAGGINGRKITWVVDDTTSTPAGAETAAKDLIENKGVFAVAELSSVFYGAAPYLNSAGIPVTGSALDWPEWYQQPNTNLFSFTGDAAPSGPAYGDGGFWKAIGATKITYVESNVTAAIDQGNSVYDSIARDGLHACDKTIVPLGSVNFTAFALSFKADGCNAAECACVLSSSLAMATALHQAGLNKVKIVFAAGPTQQIFQNAQDEAAAQNAYFPGVVSSPTYTNAASLAFLALLRKYDPGYKGGIPDLGAADGWVVANLMVKGLQVAGKNPTRKSFITNLQKVNNWTDGGLATGPVSFAHFGVNPTTQCFSYVQFVGKKYVPFPKSGKSFCGKALPGTHT